MAAEFRAWPKIARLNRDIVITEKIDGTNAAIGIELAPDDFDITSADMENYTSLAVDDEGVGWRVWAQSRKRIITPDNDNFGFAAWVAENAPGLVRALGEGLHFGEWWGHGIQRGYGLPKGERYFSLFNTERWDRATILRTEVPNLDVVPVLYRGPFSEHEIRVALNTLNHYGSCVGAQDRLFHGLTEAEGVVVYHTASRTAFKVTLRNDEAPKGAAGHARDEEAA